jgi:hypothetical protein
VRTIVRRAGSVDALSATSPVRPYILPSLQIAEKSLEALNGDVRAEVVRQVDKPESYFSPPATAVAVGGLAARFLQYLNQVSFRRRLLSVGWSDGTDAQAVGIEQWRFNRGLPVTHAAGEVEAIAFESREDLHERFYGARGLMLLVTPDTTQWDLPKVVVAQEAVRAGNLLVALAFDRGLNGGKTSDQSFETFLGGLAPHVHLLGVQEEASELTRLSQQPSEVATFHELTPVVVELTESLCEAITTKMPALIALENCTKVLADNPRFVASGHARLDIQRPRL